MGIRPTLIAGIGVDTRILKDVKKFDIVEFDFQEKFSKSPHTEDYTFEEKSIKKIREMNAAEITEVLEFTKVTSLNDSAYGTPILATPVLCRIKHRSTFINNNYSKRYCLFFDKSIQDVI